MAGDGEALGSDAQAGGAEALGDALVGAVLGGGAGWAGACVGEGDGG